MDAALLKTTKVRKIVRIRPEVEAEAGAHQDVSFHGTLVEVADPRALRPKDFRADFIHAPSSSVEDVAQCDLPPMLDAVLGGTDATLIVVGAEGAGQADLIDGPIGHDGSAQHGLGTHAAIRLISELQERQARHRKNGSGGYAYSAGISCCQVTGERVDDLLTDRPEPCRVVETNAGVTIEGLRNVNVVGTADAEHAIGAAQRRRNTALRGRSAMVLMLQVTQADYMAGWGLHGRFMLFETPAANCLAEDRGLVQLRDGYDTFRGLYHLQSLVHAWRPLQPGDVAVTTTTALLRDVLCGGSVMTAVLLCLQQGQPVISLAALEFLDAFGKVETNPVCCDHRVAGFAQAMRAERLLRCRDVGLGRPLAEAEDQRRIILELEKRLHMAERVREDVIRSEEFRDSRSRDLQDKLVSAFKGEEALHARLTGSEEEHLEACRGIVEMQLANVEVRDELSEARYKDSVMFVVLEQEIADLQVSVRQRQEQGMEAESGFDSARHECSALEDSIAELRAHQAHQAEEEEMRRESLRQAAEADAQRELSRELRSRLEGELQALRRLNAELEEHLRLAREAAAAQEAGRNAADEELLRAKGEFQRALGELGAASNQATPPEDATLAGSDVASEAARRLMEQRRLLQSQVRELQEKLVRASHIGLGWAPTEGANAEKGTLRDAARDIEQRAAEAAASDTVGARQDEVAASAMRELEREQQKIAVERVGFAHELQRKDAEQAALRAELAALRHDSGAGAQAPTAPSGGDAVLSQIQQQLLLEIDALRRRGDAGGRVSPGVADASGGQSHADLVEKNRALQARVDLLEQQTPADQRARLQRLAYMEKAMPKLEAERSELLVRATVAEEQLSQLQRHLRELTETYQMQIVSLKLQLAK